MSLITEPYPAVDTAVLHENGALTTNPLTRLRSLMHDAALEGYPIKLLLTSYFNAVAQDDADSIMHLGLLAKLAPQWERLVAVNIHQLPEVDGARIADAKARMTQTHGALQRLRLAIAELDALRPGPAARPDTTKGRRDCTADL